MKSDISQNSCIKNAVLISFDSLRSDYIAEASPVDLPVFSLMRDEGIFFKNTIVQAPFTIPSHASMFSGLYPAKTGVHDMHERLSPGISTIFTILKEKGFCTISSSPTEMLKNRGFDGIDHHIAFRNRELAKVITKLNGKPFFAFLHYWGTHTPYETHLPGFKPIDVMLNMLSPLERFSDIRYLRRILGFLWLQRVKRIRKKIAGGVPSILPAAKRGYQKALIKADRFVDSILDVLEMVGVTDETLFILTGDHGDSFNEHNEINRAADRRYEHGQFLYDNILKVPLIFYCRNKKFLPAPDIQVQEIDIMPTIRDALGIKYDGSLDGKSLWSACLAKGEKIENDFAFSEVVRESLGVELRCVRTMSSKLICDYKNKAFELYDLSVDPEEKNNLWPAEGHEEKAILLNKLVAFSKIDDKASTTASREEQQQIEYTLRSLGYIE